MNYFKSFPNREDVQYFVIDMNHHFRRVGQLCFPHAKIVADRFHVSRQVYWAMDAVRKAEQKNLSSKFRKYFKRSRALAYKYPEDLTVEEMSQLALMFEIAPRFGRAYHLKNQFMEVMHSENAVLGKRKLAEWLHLAEMEKLPEFQRCTTAYHNWSREIVNALEVPYSNGFTEGCNNKIKVLKRVSFGIRCFERLRTRILHADHLRPHNNDKRCQA